MRAASDDPLENYVAETWYGMMGKEFNIAGRAIYVTNEIDADSVLNLTQDEVIKDRSAAGAKAACDYVRQQIGMVVRPQL